MLKAYNKHYKIIKEKDDLVPIYMILFDELGLAEKAPTNPLKALYNELEYGGKREGVCFIGINNYFFDAYKMNRTLTFSIPNFKENLDQLKTTSLSIVESISEDIAKDTSIIYFFDILSRAYFLYKYYLILILLLIHLLLNYKNHEFHENLIFFFFFFF